MALPRPALMSMPEWPPLRPDTLRRYRRAPGCRVPPGDACGRRRLSRPPAQPMVRMPSSSLSRLSRYLGPEPAGPDVAGAGEAGLLVHGDQHLQRARAGPRVGEHRQGRAHADAVVGPQGGALGPQHVPVPHQLDGVPGEVVAGAFVLFADHVHVGLQGHAGAAFPARGRPACGSARCPRRPAPPRSPGPGPGPPPRRRPRLRPWTRGGSWEAPGSSCHRSWVSAGASRVSTEGLQVGVDRRAVSGRLCAEPPAAWALDPGARTGWEPRILPRPAPLANRYNPLSRSDVHERSHRHCSRSHRSIRKFTAQPVADDLVAADRPLRPGRGHL